MSIAERLASPTSRSKTKYCQVGNLLVNQTVEFEDYAALVKALADRKWNSTAIARILADEGSAISEKHLRAHRRGDHSDRECAAPTIGVIQ